MNARSEPKRWRVVFAGTPAYAVPTLQALLAHPSVEVVCVLTQKAKPKGRGLHATPSPVATVAEAHGLFTLTPDKLRDETFMSLLRGCQADVGVVVAYGKIIPTAVLSLLPHGWLNAHASLLPRWRGASPIQQAILAGDAETGVTLMQLDAGMDTGAMLADAHIPIDASATAGSLATVLQDVSAKLVHDNIEAYCQGTLTPRAQPSTGVTMAPLVTRADGRLDFHNSAAYLERQVRAFTPWPGAWAQLGSLTVKILEAETTTGSLSPGVCSRTPSGFAVGTAKDLFTPLRVQVAGKQPMQSAAFWNGYAKFLPQA